MTALSCPWLLAVAVAPLLAGLAAGPKRSAPALRAWAIAATLASLALAVCAAVELHVRGAPFAVDPLDPGVLLGTPVLAIDGLSALLLPFAALIGALVQLAAPRASFSSASARRSMAGLTATLASFACVHAAALVVLWTLAAIPAWLELRESESGRATHRVFALYMVAGAACAFAGVATLARAPAWGAGWLVLAVLLRKGIVPLHSWLPEMFERASLGTSTLFHAPQLGAYVAVRLALPAAPDGLLLAMGTLALITAIYGAGLALVQSEARRAFGFFFMSQSALVLLGLDCTSAVGLTGSLVWWLASGLSLAGHGICLWLLESRRGTTSLRELHGGAERMPVLAAGFLVLGLASVGFPGTVGFVGAELLVSGAVERFPHAGFAILCASGLNAITVVKMYFALFCGRRVAMPGHQRLQPHESIAMLVLIAAVFLAGLWPRQLVASRARAAAAILAARR